MSSHLGRGCAGRQKSLDKQKGIEEAHKEPHDRETARRQEMITVMEFGIPEGVMRTEGRVEAAGWADGGGVGGNLGRPLMSNKGAQMVVVGAGPLKRVWGNQSYMFILELSPWLRVEDELEGSGAGARPGTLVQTQAQVVTVQTGSGQAGGMFPMESGKAFVIG